MEWYEWVATAATGGLYAVGKTVYQASQAAEQVGQQVSADVEKVADEAASALDKLFRSLNTSAFEIAQTIKNIDELFKLERPDGRADSELLPEELRRKNDLSAKLAWLQARAQDDQNILNNPGNLRPDRIVDIEADLADTNAKIELVEREIADIVYQEPGYIPETVRSLDQVVQRFNTEEQPRIEHLIESLDQTVLESKKTLQETQATIAQARTFLRLLQGLVTNRWVKIGAIVIVALFGLILLFGTIALFRVAFRV